MQSRRVIALKCSTHSIIEEFIFLQQWFNMYAPIRMDMHAKASFSDTSNDSTDIVPQSLDVAKVFKGKSDKK